MTDLVNLPLHIVLTARQKDQMDAQGNKIGVTFDGEKSTPYLPDIILRFGDGKGYTAIVEKDRSGTYPIGHVLTNPSFNDFAGAISHGTPLQLPNDAAAAQSTARLLAVESDHVSMATAEQAALIQKACKALNIQPPSDAEFAALTEADARDIMERYKQQYAARKAATQPVESEASA